MKFNIKKIVLWLALIMIVSFVIGGVIFFTTNGKYLLKEFLLRGPYIIYPEKISEKIDQKKELTAKEIDVVDINAIDSDVKLIPTTNEDIRIHFYGESISIIEKGLSKLELPEIELPKLIVNKSNNQLTIEIKYPKAKTGIDIRPYKYNTYLDIYLSKYPVKDIKINTVSGNTNIKDLFIKDFHYETVSGDVSIYRITK